MLLSVLLALATSPPSHAGDPSTLAAPRLLQQEEAPPPAPANTPAWPLPRHWFEVSFNDDSSLNVAYRHGLGVGGGFLGGSLLFTEDEDWAADVRVMRYGRPGGSRFTLGAGLGFQVISIDEPSEEAYALTFIGHGEYAFPTSFPTAASLEAAFAPDATTFDGGDGILDLKARLSVEVGAFARVFVGYRFFEVGLSSGGDFDMAEAFDLGIGLAW